MARPRARSSPTACDITDVDPIRYELLFERFLNPGRKSMPDIDIDFSVHGRERVMSYVVEKYGRERVAQIITFGKLAAKAATRDTGRVLGLPFAVVDRIAKMIPEGPKVGFDDCLKPGQELQAAYDDPRPIGQDPSGPRDHAKLPDRHGAPARGPRPAGLDPRRRRRDRRPRPLGVPAAAAQGRRRPSS